MATTLQLIMLALVGGTFGQTNNTDYKLVLASILGQLEGCLELHLRNSAKGDNNLVQFLMKLRENALKISLNQKEFPSDLKTTRHNFYLFGNVQQMQDILISLDNTDGFYILALEKYKPEDDAILVDFMAKAWLQHGHSRIYYVQMSLDRILLYNPFKQSLVVVQDPEAYGRIYKNLEGYPLTIYIFDSVYSSVRGDGENNKVLSVAGADAKLAKTVARQLNFTPQYLWPDDEFFGGRLADGSFSGGVGRAHRGEVDIIFAGFFVKDYLTTHIQFSAAVYMDELCLYVQKAQRIPQSILPLFAVHTDVWLCFLMVGLVGSLVWLILRALNLGLRIERIPDGSLTTEISNFGAARRIFIDTWVVWVRVNVGSFPPFHSERIFVASLCLVSVIFGALLESSLATVYIRPRNNKNNNNSSTNNNNHRRGGRRTNENLPLNSSALYDLLEQIMKHKASWPFLRPVLTSEVPDYHQIIKSPMDLAKIKSKLNMGAYQLNEELLSDIQLVFRNCDLYNVEGNEIYDAGCQLEQFVIERCKDMQLPFRPSDMNEKIEAY